MKKWKFLIAISLLALCFIGCSDDEGGGLIDPGVDETAPAAVDDLAVSDPTDGSATLSWTSVGDDGYFGRARQYDIRFSRNLITPENFEAASAVDSVLYPKVVGYDESYTMLGLPSETKYYFAMKVGDEVPNWSAMSNVDSVTTLIAGDWLHFNMSNSPMLSDEINDFAFDAGKRYFGTENGFYIYDGSDWSSYFHDTLEVNSIIGDRIYSLAVDAIGRVWIATRDNGLSRFDGTNFTNFTDSTSDLTTNSFTSIVVDNNDQVYAGSISAGIFKFNPIDGSWTNYDRNNSSLSQNNISCLAVDDLNNLWIGLNFGGVSKYNGVDFENFTPSGGFPSNEAWAIDFDMSNNVWLATDNGLIKYDGGYTIYDIDNSGLIDNVVISLSVSVNGVIWVGTRYGLNRFKGVDWKSITTGNSLIPSNFMNVLKTDPTGNLYIGTPKGAAVYTENISND